MPVEAIPVSAELLAYLSVAEADDLAAGLGGLASWNAASAGAKGAALNQASSDVDAAMPYQGRPVEADQPRQFPRVAFSAGVNSAAHPARATDVFWDWDDATNAAVVPKDVRLAVLHQADAILSGTREPRLGAQHDGVVYELTGTLAESYKQNTGPGVWTGLCRRAWMLMRRYRLRGGRIL